MCELCDEFFLCFVVEVDYYVVVEDELERFVEWVGVFEEVELVEGYVFLYVWFYVVVIIFWVEVFLKMFL